MKLRIGPAGNAGVAAISVMVETIGGIVGVLAMVEANSSLEERGILTEMPSPEYGYVRISVILHARMAKSLYNDWVDGNLDGLTYVDRQGRNRGEWSFICQLQWCSFRYHMRYTRGVAAKGDMRDSLEEFQIDKVAVQRDIPTKNLGDGEITGDMRARLRRVGRNSGQMGQWPN